MGTLTPYWPTHPLSSLMSLRTPPPLLGGLRKSHPGPGVPSSREEAGLAEGQRGQAAIRPEVGHQSVGSGGLQAGVSPNPAESLLLRGHRTCRVGCARDMELAQMTLGFRVGGEEGGEHSEEGMSWGGPSICVWPGPPGPDWRPCCPG